MDPAESATAEARALMQTFARRTGLLGGSERRYLWTDAYAVCNYLTLHRRTGDPPALALARDLVARVHQVLGCFHPDDPRRGWISGLSESEGSRHPTAGGLRIGKPLPERAPGEPIDERLEWERDGQYFHYLTRWMHALARVALATGDRTYHRQALELARAAHDGFSHPTPRGATGLYWKMSTDLSRPLVWSQGSHDALDGLATFCELRAGARRDELEDWPGIGRAIDELAAACEGAAWRTDDALGIGGTLSHAGHLARLPPGAALDGRLLEALLHGALWGLEAFARSGTLRLYPDRRLAFRELGLVLGIQALEGLAPPREALERVGALVEEALAYRSMANAILAQWRNPNARASDAWAAHQDINDVMLASALAPDECVAV